MTAGTTMQARGDRDRDRIDFDDNPPLTGEAELRLS
jgi:hypothetical protein